jgi:hypothetical protein
LNIEAARKHRREQNKKTRKERKELSIKKRGVAAYGLEDWEIEGAILFYLDPTTDRVKATRGIRGVLMADDDKVGQLIVKLNILDQLIDSLSRDHPHELFVEALWAITNLAATSCARDVANGGAIKAIYSRWRSDSCDFV